MTLPDIKRVMRRGRAYLYLRAPAGLVRLPDLPLDSPEFLAAYAAARVAGPGGRPARGVGRAAPGTLGALAAGLMASAAWRARAPNTRRNLASIIGRILDGREDLPAAGIRNRHVKADLAPLAPAVARVRLKAWRVLLAHGVETGALPVNAAADVKPPRYVTDGHAPWTADDMARFRARWPVGTPQRRAFEVLQWTGARIGDAVTLGRQHIGADGWISWRQGKTGGAVSIPLTCPLPAWAAPMAEDHAHVLRELAAMPPGDLLFTATRTGAARSVKAAGAWLAAASRDARAEGLDEAAAAALPPRTAHGLRKTRATALAETGASEHRIAAWTGHDSLAEVQRYTRTAGRRAVLRG